jgi:hypothetical protein
VNGVERHNLFMSLTPGVEHPQSVEPPPWNVERCYEHIEDDHDSRAQEGTGKSPVATDQSKKRARSSQTNKSPKDSTRKYRQTMQGWSEDKAEEDASAYMLNPQKKRSKQTT